MVSSRSRFAWQCLVALVVCASLAQVACLDPPPRTPFDGGVESITVTPKTGDGAKAAAPAPPKPAPIELKRPDFCRACQSVVEEFHKFTVSNFGSTDLSRRNLTMSRLQLVEWFCRTGAFGDFQEALIWGCVKTVQDHHNEVLAPFLGTHSAHEYSTLAAVWKHRAESCALINACDAPAPEPRSTSECESCDRLVRDIHWSLTRERVINETTVERTLRVICMEVGMRHEKPMEIESFCHEYVDEHWSATNKMLVKIFTDASIPVHDQLHQLKRRFCGGLTEVCEPERKEMAAEMKAEKAKERAQREADRVAKKKRGMKQPDLKIEL